MVYNVLLTGVGGEGILFTSVLIAKAANLEGYEVRGTQLHGLAQRGGAIPAHIRIGKKVYSPLIPRGEADLLFALEPLEAARFCYFASKERTSILIDNFKVKPVYANLLDQEYPTNEKIKQMIEPFAKKIFFVDASNICEEKLGDPIYGNVYLIGVAIANNLLPIKKSSIEQILKASLKDPEKDLKAFKMGLEHKL
ncbi:MAG: indolepyruvate oxidoreductase subunit beta [Candidatus Aenigmatarchaeota archaeon]